MDSVQLSLSTVPPTHTHTLGTMRKMKYKYYPDAAPNLGSETLQSEIGRTD